MIQTEKAGTVNCLQCRYYFVTWDPAAPYGCRAHGFKSKQNPAGVVYQSSGIVCQLYESKKSQKK